jgi:hypothetical protein
VSVAVQEGDSPSTFNVLGDPLASQASFPFSQLPEVSFGVGEEGEAAADEAGKLPDFLTDLLDEKEDEGKSKGGKKTPALMYQLVSARLAPPVPLPNPDD